MTIRYKQCPECNKLNLAGEHSCDRCGKELLRDCFGNAPAVSVFESGYYRDIDIEPVYIKNRKQLLDETRRRGQVSLYAED